MPIFEYDHLVPYADVKEHVADNIILLCPNHHREKTARRLGGDRLQYAASNPFNHGRQHTAPFTIEEGRDIAVIMGSNSVLNPHFDHEGNFFVIWLNGYYWVGLHKQGDWMTLSASITDNSGNLILVIDHGQLIAATDVWDYRYEGTRLQIRAKSRDIILDIELTNESFQMHHGLFVDPRDGSGFMVSEGALHGFSKRGVMQSHIRMKHSGCRGGWGIGNRQLCDPNARPGGFASFSTI